MTETGPGVLLVVGLGNPGVQYEHTRHNAGAWFIQEIVRQSHAVLRFEPKFKGYYCELGTAGQRCHLLVPTTYMNHSGQSVQAVSQFYKVPAKQILVAHDEIDLPVGDVRLKYDGGHGGHNGLRDIFHHLHTQTFYRLRVGVGRPSHSSQVHDYVLSPPKKEEYEQIQAGLMKAYSVFPMLLAGEIQKGMQKLHSS